MKFHQVAVAAGLAIAALSAGAQTSTFVNNGGVHEAYEYASDTFALPVTSVLDKFTFTLASLTTLDAQAVKLGGAPVTGVVSLYKDSTVDTLLGSFTFATGSGKFASLAAGDYFYTVSASGSKGGGFLLGSYATAPVPEPESYALMLAGLALVGAKVGRRKAA